MANPLYGQNKADGNIGWLRNNSLVKDHGTLAGGLTLVASDLVNAVAHTCDPAAAKLCLPVLKSVVSAQDVPS